MKTMVLQFLCPNGHKIHCPEDRGGMPAKCPKCGVKFQVPSPDESDSVPSQGPVDTAEGGSTVSAGAAVGVESAVAEPVEDQIEFLCPNGHRL
ncbi:MAG: hypothetical protein HQ581_05800, partial [Planctomycetes bacterium]|nr:hypothetical protein [Planctomycetota bacterium]